MLVPSPTTGLCGNFNDNVRDDFIGTSGLVEGTAVAFGNNWKRSASCRDVTTNFGEPCSQNFNKSMTKFPLLMSCHIISCNVCHVKSYHMKAYIGKTLYLRRA